jgi:hypothetical protein
LEKISTQEHEYSKSLQFNFAGESGRINGFARDLCLLNEYFVAGRIGPFGQTNESLSTTLLVK